MDNPCSKMHFEIALASTISPSRSLYGSSGCSTAVLPIVAACAEPRESSDLLRPRRARECRCSRRCSLSAAGLASESPPGLQEPRTSGLSLAFRLARWTLVGLLPSGRPLVAGVRAPSLYLVRCVIAEAAADDWRCGCLTSMTAICLIY